MEDQKWWASAEHTLIMRSALEELRREQQDSAVEIFEQLVFAGLSGDEVAKRYSKSRNQIYGIKFRIMERLKQIARKMIEDWDG